LDPRAVVCPRCGVAAAGPEGAKNKTAAVLLAVFLGPWTWLYTYARDSKKFWIGMSVSVGWIVLLILAFTAFTSGVASIGGCTAQQIEENVCSGLTGTSAGFGFATLATIVAWILFPGLWLWALIDTATKKDWFFTNYPNG
jgi:hypothetical protein